jgi:NADH-quinone oxidoreductase subunit N
MVLAGAGFKLAAVPFHLWTPDVFEASPAPVTAFVATVSKAAVLAAVLRFFQPALAGCGAAAPGCAGVLQASLAGIAIASMFGGNLLALRQRNLKRLLAYSSIAHMGYMLVAFVGSSGAARAIAFYLPAYFVTTLAAFAVIAGLSGPGEWEMPSDYRGLARRRPLAAAALAAAMLSLAGIPLTAGFLGKFWVMYGGLQSGRTLLVAALVVNSGIGLYYYLRVVIALYATTETTTAKTTATASPRSAGGFNDNDQDDSSSPAIPPGAVLPAEAAMPVLTGLALVVLIALVVALGVCPGPLLQIIQQTFGP